MFAVIGGSGLSQLENLEVTHREIVRTPYGDPSSALLFGRISERPVVFLARHGHAHTVPPHEVNYRANIWALSQVGVTEILSVASVGSIRADLAPGDLVVPHQIIDYTWGRKSTYSEGPGAVLKHVDFTEPYDGKLRARLINAAKSAGLSVSDSAVYAVMQGPRLETAAEIDRLEKDGADVVGMTGMPEAVLARELDIAYAAINVVANYAAGRAESRDGIRFELTPDVLRKSMARILTLIEKTL
ncbi:MAG: S-methyl-5'-thioinosine phosphorylase [Candidatus Accumulibacter sp.]|jgi:5'-methylthioadenosine phosphorylase|nr:S-methyl-5'-thioinosine phosphorylase [Accumulibacter sp.]